MPSACNKGDGTTFLFIIGIFLVELFSFCDEIQWDPLDCMYLRLNSSFLDIMLKNTTNISNLAVFFTTKCSGK